MASWLLDGKTMSGARMHWHCSTRSTRVTCECAARFPRARACETTPGRGPRPWRDATHLAHPLLESTTFPGAKDTRERAGNIGKFLSLVPTLGISHSGEKSRENIGFPECFQKTHGNYYNFPCVMIPECFKGTHRNYYSLPCVLIFECFKGIHGNLL